MSSQKRQKSSYVLFHLLYNRDGRNMIHFDHLQVDVILPLGGYDCRQDQVDTSSYSDYKYRQKHT